MRNSKSNLWIFHIYLYIALKGWKCWKYRMQIHLIILFGSSCNNPEGSCDVSRTIRLLITIHYTILFEWNTAKPSFNCGYNSFMCCLPWKHENFRFNLISLQFHTINASVAYLNIRKCWVHNLHEYLSCFLSHLLFSLALHLPLYHFCVQQKQTHWAPFHVFCI